MKYVIVGGVAAGASAAARLRRLDEKAGIVLFEKGAEISYANCGLPYHVGGVIKDRERLSVMPPEKFAAWFNADVRTKSEVVSVDRAAKRVTVRGPAGEYAEPYDRLLLATGATPAGDAYSDAEHPRVAHLWTIADMDRVLAKLGSARKVAVVGAGFIGVELVENLVERGLEVVLIQRGGHVLPIFDREMAQPLAAELRSLGVEILFDRMVSAYNERPDRLELVLDDGKVVPADLAVVSTGVRPQSDLAKNAGLQLGPRGHIVVDESLRTSDPDIFAAGDVIEVVDPIFGGKTAISLAGPANKQGRIAADNMAGGSSAYKGTLGASVVKVGALTAASVGSTEERLAASGRTFRKIYIHPSSAASYYPGAARLSMKLLFGDDGTIFGAQLVGSKGVDKRIDTIAQAMRNGRKAPDLGELELAYAPPYSSAKDPVNFLGFVAENVLTGKSDVVSADAIPADAQIIDVREPVESELGSIPGSINIQLADLRNRMGELAKDRFYVTCCAVGLRGYLAERILKQNGFKVANLSGGMATWKLYHPEPLPQAAPDPAPSPARAPAAAGPISTTLDVRQLPCPGPVVQLKATFKGAEAGFSVRLTADASFEADLRRWCASNGCTVNDFAKSGGSLAATLVKDGSDASAAPTASAGSPGPHSVALVVFSNDLDKVLAALVLANGLAASGAEVGIFFTFWGLTVLRKNPAPSVRKNLVSRMFGWMLPTGATKLALSKMHMLGMGTGLMKGIMKKQNIMSLPELIRSAKSAGVKFIACDMAMGVMGITREELIDEVDEVAGVAAFAELARKSNNTLFI